MQNSVIAGIYRVGDGSLIIDPGVFLSALSNCYQIDIVSDNSSNPIVNVVNNMALPTGADDSVSPAHIAPSKSRKRKKDVSKWKKLKAKILRQSKKEYTSSSEKNHTRESCLFG